jgi:hypothetical protein
MEEAADLEEFGLEPLDLFDHRLLLRIQHLGLPIAALAGM